MKTKTPNLVNLILSAVLAVGVLTVFRACAAMEDGMWMHCHYAQMDVFYIALALAVVSLIAMLMKSKGAVLCLNILQIVGAVVALLMPGTIMSMCMMKDMRCWSVMKPFTTVMAILVILCAVWSLIAAVKKK